MEVPVSRGEGSADDAAEGVSKELGVEVEIVGAAVAGGTTGVSRREEADDVESDAPCNTSPLEEGQVEEGTSTSLGTLPDPEATPDTSSLGAIS
jgi:hypothetical protein